MLIDHKSKLEAKIKHLEEEFKTIKFGKGKEILADRSLMSKTEQLGVNFEKLRLNLNC